MILNQLIKHSSQQVLLPFYHLVSSSVPSYAKHLYKPRNINQFKEDLDLFLAHYQAINLEEVIALTHHPKQLKKPAFHLTFDDGLANFYDEIAPILIAKNISATIFLNTAFVDNKDLFYRYKASLLITHYLDSNEDVRDEYWNFFGKRQEARGEKQEARNKRQEIFQFLLSITYENKVILDELADCVNYSFSDYLKTEKPYLTTQQIKELQQKGFTFGAHSVDHPLYANLSLVAQLQQTKSSLEWLQKQIQPKHSVFSFPFHDIGVTNDFFDEISNDLSISFGTSGFKKENVWFHLHRLDMEKSKGSTKRFLINNYLKLVLKTPFGKHKVTRK